MNKISIFIFTLLLICGGALWFLASGSLNDFIKVQIEQVGSESTQQVVTVGSVDIKLGEGLGQINQLTLSNPNTYQYPHAFTLDKILLDINLESLGERQPIIIDELRIENAHSFVEFQQNARTNIQDILDKLEQSAEANGNDEEQSSSADKGKLPNIAITKLVMLGTSLKLNLEKLGNKEHELTLADININNIGGSQGVPANELGVVIGKAMLKAIYKQAKKEQKKALKSTLKEKAMNKLKDLF